MAADDSKWLRSKCAGYDVDDLLDVVRKNDDKKLTPYAIAELQARGVSLDKIHGRPSEDDKRRAERIEIETRPRWKNRPPWTNLVIGVALLAWGSYALYGRSQNPQLIGFVGFPYLLLIGGVIYTYRGFAGRKNED